jgi:hypothetical protein
LEVIKMTKIQRFTSLGLAVALLLSAFAVGRWTTPESASADAVAAKFVPASQPVASPVETVENSKFYLSDYKTGYNDGFSNAKTGQGTGVLDRSRAGYNEGFKEGYANGHQEPPQATVRPQPVRVINTTVNRTVPVRTVTNYRTVERPVYRETRARNSKLKTALTIAAPAAVGAGIAAHCIIYGKNNSSFTARKARPGRVKVGMMKLM